MSQISSVTTASELGAVVQLTGNSGGVVSPDSSGNINIVGATGIVVVDNPGTHTLTISGSTEAGSFVTNSGTATPAAGILNLLGGTGVTTSGSGNTVTVAASSAVAESFLTDSGTAVPAAGIITFHGTQGSVFTGSGSTVTLTFNDLELPSTNVAQTQGVIKINGTTVLNAFGTDNIFLGAAAGNTSLSSASNNVALGNNVLSGITTGSNNISIGETSGESITSAIGNILIGDSAGSDILAGSYNVILGNLSGTNYVASESYNVLLGSEVAGSVSETNIMRLGATSTAAAITATYIAGIDGVNVGSVARVVTEASNQLGTAVITAGTGISITPTANVITISATGTTTLNYTGISSGPYTVLSTDDYIGVTSSSTGITVKLPNAPATGRVVIIKDTSGNSSTYNITVTTVGGAVDIDGATSFIMNTNYESAQFIFNGTSYEIF